jgi:hypothetical protein
LFGHTTEAPVFPQAELFFELPVRLRGGLAHEELMTTLAKSSLTRKPACLALVTLIKPMQPIELSIHTPLASWAKSKVEATNSDPEMPEPMKQNTIILPARIKTLAVFISLITTGFALRAARECGNQWLVCGKCRACDPGSVRHSTLTRLNL